MHKRISAAFFVGAFMVLLNAESFEAATKGWTAFMPAGSPPPRGLASGTTYDAANNRLIALFPGNPNPPLSEPPATVWVLSHANGVGGNPTWTQLATAGTPPLAHSQNSVAYDAVSNRIIVYGGCTVSCSPARSDVHVLTDANGLGGTPTWSQLTVTNPQARAAHSAVYDDSSGQMIAFGGNLAFFGTDQNDTRVLSNANGLASPSTWTALTPSGGLPPIRNFHAAVYDSANNRMIVYAGDNYISTCCPYNIAVLADVWVLANANGIGGTPAWTKLLPGGKQPPARSSHSAIYDHIRNKMIVLGGLVWSNPAQATTVLGDVWELSYANGLGGIPKWKQLGQLGTPPGANYGQIAGYDAARRRMIVFGGGDRNFVSHSWLFVLQL